MDVNGLFQAHHQSLTGGETDGEVSDPRKPTTTNYRQRFAHMAPIPRNAVAAPATRVGRSMSLPSYLPVELDGEDVVGVAVVADLGSFLKVIDVHPPRHGLAHHHHQAAGEQPLHDAHVGTLHWGERKISVCPCHVNRSLRWFISLLNVTWLQILCAC